MAGRHRKPAPPRLHRLGVVAASTACAGGLLALPATAAAAPGNGLFSPVTGLLGSAEEPGADAPAPTPAAGSEQPPEASLGERIVAEAARHEGAPYEYGAAGPDSFDCSGFTQHVFGKVGVALPRTSQQQRDATAHVDRGNEQLGDLIFSHDGGRVYHVGIYAGEGRMWHSPQSGEAVRLDTINDSSYTVGRAQR